MTHPDRRAPRTPQAILAHLTPVATDDKMDAFLLVSKVKCVRWTGKRIEDANRDISRRIGRSH